MYLPQWVEPSSKCVSTVILAAFTKKSHAIPTITDLKLSLSQPTYMSYFLFSTLFSP